MKNISIALGLSLCMVSCGSKNGGDHNSANSASVNQKAVQPTTNSAMINFEGGDFMMGRNNGLPNESPAHKVTVAPFSMDKYLVTVAQFREFTRATGYLTEAEKFKDSGVFDFKTAAWSLLPGAYWEMPLGPQSAKAEDNHPVTHVSWNDAVAYAAWAQKRLPTEAEWEFAARNGGKTDTQFPWGNEVKVDGKWMLNIFQGTMQDIKTDDGYLTTNPVGAFGETPSGLCDMCGNVWQWTADSYAPYSSVADGSGDETIKVLRGGSFMYDQAGDQSATVYFRSQNSYETSLFNTGFRCAK